MTAILGITCAALLFVMIVGTKPEILSIIADAFGLGGRSNTVGAGSSGNAIDYSAPGAPLRKFKGPDASKQSWKKPVMFLFFPVYIYFLFNCQAELLIKELGVPLLYGAWLVIGLAGHSLVPFSSFEDDGGRKMLNFAYKATFVVFVVAVAIWRYTGSNPLMLKTW